MNLFPAIDIVQGKAVRLFKGDYDCMTVYSEHPEEVAVKFQSCGANHIHLVDLEGAKSGTTPNLDTVRRILECTDLFVEIGGGIRSMKTIETYLSAGVDRVILGTAALQDENFLKEALRNYADKIAVGVDLRDGKVAVHGWTETSDTDGITFCQKMQRLGVTTLICTDISKDGAMEGTNLALYRKLKAALPQSLQLTASGGVSSLEEIRALREIGVYGAILGKAYYTGAVDLKEALEVAKGV